MNHEKTATVVKNYAIVEGWLTLSVPLLILGYILKERINSEREYKGIMIALAVIYGLLAMVSISAIVFIAIELVNNQFMIPDIITFILFLLMIYFFIGRPFRYAIENLLNKEMI